MLLDGHSLHGLAEFLDIGTLDLDICSCPREETQDGLCGAVRFLGPTAPRLVSVGQVLIREAEKLR